MCSLENCLRVNEVKRKKVKLSMEGAICYNLFLLSRNKYHPIATLILNIHRQHVAREGFLLAPFTESGKGANL